MRLPGRSPARLAVPLLGVAVLAAAAACTGRVADAPMPAPAHRLTVPATLDGGRYALVDDMSAELQRRYVTDVPGTAGMTAVGGRYRRGRGPALDIVSFWGGYGQLPGPAALRQVMMSGLGLPASTRRATAPLTLTPAGTRLKVVCEVLVQTAHGTPITLPVCAWSDRDTAFAVANATPRGLHQPPAAVDLRPLAALTATIHDEVRVPAG